MQAPKSGAAQQAEENGLDLILLMMGGGNQRQISLPGHAAQEVISGGSCRFLQAAAGVFFQQKGANEANHLQ